MLGVIGIDNKKASLARGSFALVVTAEQVLHLGAEIRRAFLQPFTHLVAGEPPNPYVLSGLRNHLSDQGADGDVLVFDERLFHQTSLLVKLAQPAFDNLIEHLLRFVSVLRIESSLFKRDLT